MAAPDTESTASNLGGEPIRLTFEIGELTTSVAELAALDAGYIFPLRASLSRPVTIKANGAPFGVGELVEVDGVLTVRLLEAGRDGL
jgi:type III secretion protein Q